MYLNARLYLPFSLSVFYNKVFFCLETKLDCILFAVFESLYSLHLGFYFNSHFVVSSLSLSLFGAFGIILFICEEWGKKRSRKTFLSHSWAMSQRKQATSSSREWKNKIKCNTEYTHARTKIEKKRQRLNKTTKIPGQRKYNKFLKL